MRVKVIIGLPRYIVNEAVLLVTSHQQDRPLDCGITELAQVTEADGITTVKVPECGFELCYSDSYVEVPDTDPSDEYTWITTYGGYRKLMRVASLLAGCVLDSDSSFFGVSRG